MSIKRNLKIMYMLMKMKLQRNMAYRLSFFGVCFADGSLFLMQILMFSAIYSQVGSIGGWNKHQMLFFIGTFSLLNALNMALYFFGVISIPHKIKSGELDLYVTKPVNTLFHLSFENIDIGSVPLVFASIGIVIYAAAGMDTRVTVLTVIGYIFLILIMLVLYYDMEVILRTFPFFVIQSASIERFEEGLLSLCMRIPGILFKGAFKMLFYLVLPYGIMATIPTQFFSGILSPAGFIYSVAVVVVFTVFTIAFWKFGLKNYKSTGS